MVLHSSRLMKRYSIILTDNEIFYPLPRFNKQIQLFTI